MHRENVNILKGKRSISFYRVVGFQRYECFELQVFSVAKQQGLHRKAFELFEIRYFYCSVLMFVLRAEHSASVKCPQILHKY